MARPAYSACLYRGTSMAFGPSSLGGPPPGFKWDVRDMVAYNSGGSIDVATVLHGFWIWDDVDAVIWAVRNHAAQPLYPYHWQGRQVLEEGQTLTFDTIDFNWRLRISGYVLSVSGH